MFGASSELASVMEFGFNASLSIPYTINLADTATLGGAYDSDGSSPGSRDLQGRVICCRGGIGLQQ